MSTLAEIEQAIEQLPEKEVAELRAWLSQRDPRPALAKWRERGTGIVKQMGGVDAYRISSAPSWAAKWSSP